MSLPYFQRSARYNEWTNKRLYDACAQLDEAEYHAPRQAFFGSIHRTLNHLLLVDRIWLSRIGVGDLIADPLDTELYTAFNDLRGAREAQDRVIIGYIDAQTEATLDEMKTYANASGQPQETRHGVILQHYFNHQTHHRGQVHGAGSAGVASDNQCESCVITTESPTMCAVAPSCWAISTGSIAVIRR